MREYELATQRLEILSRIHALDGNQKKLEDLQHQLRCFVDGRFDSLLALIPAIKNGDADALKEFKKQLNTFESRFFKTHHESLSKLEIKNVDEISADILAERNAWELSVTENVEDKYPNDKVIALQYLTECAQIFDNHAVEMFQLAQADGDNFSLYQKKVSEFENACEKKKKSLVHLLKVFYVALQLGTTIQFTNTRAFYKHYIIGLKELNQLILQR